MDIILNLSDEWLLNNVYQNLAIRFHFGYLPPENLLRQYISLSIITAIFGFLFYFVTATLSYYFLFDKRLKLHPKYLPNQIELEIQYSIEAIIPMSLLTAPFFQLQINGYSLLYIRYCDYSLSYLFASIFMFLFFTDFFIYWIHRGLHHPKVYKSLHKLHHQILVPTPYASHAFHFLDGYLQSIPYHLFVFIFPFHKYLYIGFFIIVNLWTVLIHDGAYFNDGEIINSTSNHTMHHLYFNVNYGQYFTIWDKLFNSYKKCPLELMDHDLRHDIKFNEKEIHS
ncbi:hypothetical protein K502DRAFT_324881 [Neoconidiobolus thromboides FSU 785]|nr:hypothetical protein K502DRAFT_324881 [Neoconidiobolus thromboides FSU 785]